MRRIAVLATLAALVALPALAASDDVTSASRRLSPRRLLAVWSG